MRDYASNLCNASATSPSSSPSGSRPGRRRGIRWPKLPWARRRPEAGGGRNRLRWTAREKNKAGAGCVHQAGELDELDDRKALKTILSLFSAP